MSGEPIDTLARQTARLTRRTALGAVFSAGLGGLIFSETEARDRKQRRKRRRRKNNVTANAFGCLNVGDRCDGTDLQCCSGICQQQPGGGKGKQRQSFCVSHDEGGCTADKDFCAADVDEDDPAFQCPNNGLCFRTTGNASFCGIEDEGNCFVCRTDGDCEATFGTGAACVVCDKCEGQSGEFNTGCIPPATGQQP